MFIVWLTSTIYLVSNCRLIFLLISLETRTLLTEKQKLFAVSQLASLEYNDYISFQLVHIIVCLLVQYTLQAECGKQIKDETTPLISFFFHISALIDVDQLLY